MMYGSLARSWCGAVAYTIYYISRWCDRSLVNKHTLLCHQQPPVHRSDIAILVLLHAVTVNDDPDA